MATGFRASWLAVVFGACQGLALAAPVAPGPTLRFFQEDHALANQTTVRTSIGRLQVDLIRLRRDSGLSSGFVNVATAQGWVVRNVPVLTDEQYPYARLAPTFDLAAAAGATVASVNAAVDFSASPLATYSGTLASHSVRPLTVTLTGFEETAFGAPTPPNPAAAGALQGLETSVIANQSDHPNVQAATNQCFPMAVANSLAFLYNTKSLELPHVNKPGLKGDDSLVGQLDTLMERNVTSRTSGSGVGARKGLEGKLKYLAQNKLNGKVTVRHWGGGLGGDVSATVDGVTVTSKQQSDSFNFDAVATAMQEGDNCEMGYRWNGGGHFVDLVAAGKIGGRPWLVHASDLRQTDVDADDTKGANGAGFQPEVLGEPDATGKTFLSGSNRYVGVVICEKVVPPVFTVTIIEIIDPLRHLGFVGPPPTVADFAFGNGTMTVSGSSTYLPFSGTYDAMTGSFNLSSTRSVAGRPSVRSTFIGKRVGDSFEGQVVIGANGELNGVPLTYTWRISPPASRPQPAMRINGFRGAATAEVGDPLQLSISMRSGAAFAVAADWWLVASAGGTLYHYDLATSSWVPGLAPSYTGTLFDLSYFALPRLEGLPAGSYTFYFGFDTVPNGQLDIDKAVYESTVLTITPPT